MRALISWDVDPSDPQFQQIILDLGATLPVGRVSPLTNHTGLIDPITTGQFQELARQLERLAARYEQRPFLFLSLHPSNSVIWGAWRQPGTALLAADDSLGFGKGAGAPGRD